MKINFYNSMDFHTVVYRKKNIYKITTVSKILKVNYAMALLRT